MYDLIIIGGGVVGLWTATMAAQEGLRVAICEKSLQFAQSTSNRNSGVLHCGIYYSLSSLKSKFCQSGKEATLEFIQKHAISHFHCGKFIIPVSTQAGTVKSALSISEQEDLLEPLYYKAVAHGIAGIELSALNKREYDYLNCDVALHSRDTAIVNLSEYMNVLIHQVMNNKNIDCYLGHKFIAFQGDTIKLLCVSDNTCRYLSSRYFVNSSGLHADEVATECGLLGYEIKANKGIFMQLSKPLPLGKLIYPLPHQGSSHLGCHYTLDTEGNAFIGPNAQWAIDKYDYHINPNKEHFYRDLKALTNYYNKSDISEVNKVGLRSRLFYQEQAVHDFAIKKYPDNFIHLLGIESPGLTCAPSIAKYLITTIESPCYAT